MFGLFRSRRGLEPKEVLEVAEQHLATFAPSAKVVREEMRLRLAGDDGCEVIWNLHDFIRTANPKGDWRADLGDLASQVVEQLNAAAEVSHLGDDLHLRLRPVDRMPEVFEDSAVEEVLPGILALYGKPTAQGIALATWADVDGLGERATVRQKAALATLGDFGPQDVLTQMEAGAPLFTNGEFHPQVAVALLVPSLWRALLAGFETESLLVVAPAPSRIFITPVDDDTAVRGLAKLAGHAVSLEDELLSMSVWRFRDDRWSLVEAHH